MKNILRAVSLAMAVLLLSVFPYASAEEADEQTRKKDRSRIQYAISVTAAMVGSALDQLDSAEDVALRGQLQAFSEVRYLHPDKAVVVVVMQVHDLQGYRSQPATQVAAMLMNYWAHQNLWPQK